MNHPIRVLQISTSTKGGAPKAMLRIVEALESEQIHCRGAFYHGDTPNDAWTRLAPPQKSLTYPFFRFCLSQAKKGRGKQFESFTPSNPRRSLKLPANVFESIDIAHFHYLGGQIWDLQSLFESVPKQIPVVVTMHDMHQVTGGCHYSGGCKSYQTGCSSCPQLPGIFGESICTTSYHIKEALYQKRPISLVAPSRWLETVTRESLLGQMAHRIDYIGYPFPKPTPFHSREAARNTLGLTVAGTEKIILLVAQDLANHRKGAHLLMEALRDNRLPNCKLMLMGKELDLNNDRILQLGYLKDPAQLRSAYAAADVLCLPSLEENLAQTGIESLVEGTPVVCFAGTGPSDYVVPGLTGIVANEPTSEDLGKALLECLQNESLSDQTKVSEAYQMIYTKRYSQERVRADYAQLYNTLIQSISPAEDRSK